MQKIKITIFSKLFFILLASTSSFAWAAMENLYIKTKGDVLIDDTKKIIHTDDHFLLDDKVNRYSGKILTIYYTDLHNFNFDSVLRIEGSSNIKIETKTKALITADKYIYSAKAGVHTLIAEKQPILYVDPLRQITAKDRLEYFIAPNVVVVRGAPTLKEKKNATSNHHYSFSANLINIQLTNNSADKSTHTGTSLFNLNTVLFIEAIDKVSFQDADTTITAQYAIYYKEQNQIEFYDDVIFATSGSSVTGDCAIYNLTLGYGKIMSCNTNTPITGKYKTPTKNLHEQ